MVVCIEFCGWFEVDYMCRYTAVTERGGFEDIISERKRFRLQKQTTFTVCCRCGAWHFTFTHAARLEMHAVLQRETLGLKSSVTSSENVCIFVVSKTLPCPCHRYRQLTVVLFSTALRAKSLEDSSSQ